jgi:hypothetical protein
MVRGDRHALLLFRCADERGVVMEPWNATQGLLEARWQARRLGPLLKYVLSSPTVAEPAVVYQTQVFVSGYVPVTSAERRETRALFRTACAALNPAETGKREANP